MKKNWIIILAIFLVPALLYLGLEMKLGSNYSFAKTDGSNAIVYKFSSPLCSECKVVQKLIEEIEDDYDNVVFQEVNVGGNNASKKEIKDLIKKYNITVVPTLVFVDGNGHFHKKIEVDVTEKDIEDTLSAMAIKRNK